MSGIKTKPEVKLYKNAVRVFGGAQITVGHLLDLVERNNVPRDTILIGSADEEGNRYGYIYEMYSEKLTKNTAGDMEIPEFAGKNVIILMPAL
jgi:hypothetical protein